MPAAALVRRLAAALAAAFAVACGGDGPTEPAAAPLVAVLAGDGQSGAAGEPVSVAPSVRVTTPSGAPIAGATVRFAVAAGGGVLEGSERTTDAHGVAVAGTWRLGTALGGNSLLATVNAPGRPAAVASVVATAVAGPPARLAFVTQPLSAAADSAQTIRVELRDAHGHRSTSAAAPVELALVGSAGSVALAGGGPVQPVDGVATFADVRVTRADARYVLVASAASLPVDSSTAFAIRAGAAAALTMLHGDGQSAAAGTPVATPPAVRVLDAFGNPVAGATVAFTPSGNGAVLGGTAVTDANGDAAVSRWTLATAAGPNALSAAVGGLSAATFAATGVPGAPASIAIVDGDGQTARAATSVAIAPAVRVQDAFGNLVPGVAVTFSVAAGGGSASGTSATTDASGIARVGAWTLGPSAGANALGASVASGPLAATFTASATPNATIRGTITTTDAQLLAPRAPDVVEPLPRASRAAAAEYTPDDLLVTYHAEAADARGGRVPLVRERASDAARRVRDGLESVRDQGAARRAWRVLDVNPATLTARVRVENPGDLESLAAELRGDPRVRRVGRNAVLRRAARRAVVVSTDSAYVRQSWHYEMIEAPAAWAMTTGSPAVTVAVIDDGAQFGHPELTAAFTNDGFDFVSSGTIPNCAGGAPFDRTGDGTGYDGDPTAPRFYRLGAGGCTTGTIEPVEGHGMHVAGTIAGSGTNGVGGAGVAWRTRIRPIRIFGTDASATEMDAAKAILYAAGFPVDTGGGHLVVGSRSPVINMSFGGTIDAPALRDAVTAAAGAGSLLIAAAGNAAGSGPFYPASYPEVLAVSAVGPDGLRAAYSNFGAYVDVAAPGGDQSDGGETFGVYSTLWNYAAGTPTYGYYDGTSMASPHVAGVAALLLAREPALTAAALRARILAHARDAGAPGRDDFYGAGIVSARASLTNGASPLRRLVVRLFDATGARVRESIATAGAYAFGELPDGRYRVYAGEDEDADGIAGTPGRRWGGFGGTSVPSEIAIAGAAEHVASFAVGMPRGAEPNDGAPQAVELPMGGWVGDSLAGVDANDYFRVRIPAAGTFTFETSGIGGTCGHALAANTVLELRDASGTSVLATSDDIDTGARRFCSRITRALAAGSWILVVRRQARPDAASGGRYAIEAREGS